MPELSSVSFDRAAGFYDKTRGLTPEAAAEVQAVLADELHHRGPVLEVGVGTGRIGLLLNEAGIDLTGVDLSEAMLNRLAQNAGGASPFPVAAADATALPFEDGSFGAALTCHVLHLIPEWKQVIGEIARVVKAGGLYLNDLGEGQQMSGPRVDLMKHFADEAGFKMTLRGANDVRDVTEVVTSLGGRGRRLHTITLKEAATYEDLIKRLENGTWSCTWQVTDTARRAAGAKLRSWAESRYGDLDQKLEYTVPIEWHAYELP
jgi:ubiquinone/menaquinone biosynthesis C-methylase UbiE